MCLFHFRTWVKKLNKLVITQMPLGNGECLVSALASENRAIELRVGTRTQQGILGNIYVAQVENIARNIQAAFVQIQKGQRCYLPLKEAAQAIYTGNQRHMGELRPGDEILVQVNREAMKTKAPSVTTNLSFTGKYLVLTSGDCRLGLSSKLDAADNVRLRKWLAERKRENYGLVVRTNAAEASKEELLRELSFLEKQLERVAVYGRSRTCFSLLLEAEPFYLSAVRDAYSQELEEIVTDDRELFAGLCEYLAQYQPEDLPKLRLYEDRLLPLYKLFSLERAFNEALREKIWLKSGGFVVIQQTEAFVSIDVNTGKFTDKKKAEETFRKINLEAAGEIARQLRLRNLSGIILIDFINMQNSDHQEELLHVLARHLRKDPVKAQVIDLTALQIVETTRKKVRRSLLEDLTALGIFP